MSIGRSVEDRLAVIEEIIGKALNIDVAGAHAARDEQARLAKEAADQAEAQDRAFSKLNVHELEDLAAAHNVTLPEDASKQEKIDALKAAGVTPPEEK